MSNRVNSKIKSKRNVKPLQDSEENKYDEENDISVLSKPLAMSLSGLNTVIKAFNSATEEVQEYLSYECEILYECRICRNIFRSLSNFISHKRTYCQEKYNCVIHVKCSNKCNDIDTQVIEKEINCLEKNKDTEKNEKINKKSIKSVLEILAQKSQDGSNNPEDSIKDENCDNKDPRLNLEHINGSSSGVFQTFNKTDEDCENKIEEMQLEVAEIHNMLEGQSVVLGPDGKILEKENAINVKSNSINQTCSHCNTKFATRKTYVSHMKYKHADTRLVYPCPECEEVYATCWSVYRHLYNVHRKTMTQVRKLREQVQSKAFYQTQADIKKSPKSPKAVNEQQRIDDENQEWMNNFETDNDIQMCGGCGKRFERRAALNSHSQTCQKRIAAKNTIIINRSKRMAAAEDKTEKSEKKPAKIPKLEPIPEIRDRRKPLILKKRKIGIQIRCDYTKPTEKITLPLSSPLPAHNEEKENKTQEETDPIKDEHEQKNSEDIINEILTNEESEKDNTAEPKKQNLEQADMIIKSEDSQNVQTCSSMSISFDRKSNSRPSSSSGISNSPQDLRAEEVLSIHSSTNSTPNKEEDSSPIENMQDETDSEIEEIFSASSTVKNEFRASDLVDSIKQEDIEERDFNEGTLELIKLIGTESSAEKNKPTLDDKMARYVDFKKSQCLPCNVKFGNISKLRNHMSLHFNWMKFYCDICSFKAYEKSTLYEHIEKDHNVIESDKIDSVVFQIPEWKTIEMSSADFIDINKVEENSSKQSSQETVVSCATVSPEDNCSTPDSCIIIQTDIARPRTPKGRGRPKKRKPLKKLEENATNDKLNQPVTESENIENGTKSDAIRKMVLEVIFGQNNEQSNDSVTSKSDADTSKESITNTEPTEVNILSRPVRNRVKPVNKDFIYDLNEFTDLPRTASVSQNRSNVQQEKQVTSFEDLSGSKYKIHLKKVGKKPGPKCKTMYPVNISDNRIVNLPLQNNDNYINDFQERSAVPTHEEFSTISVLKKMDSKTIFNKYIHADGVDDEVWIIEDD